MKKWCWRTMLPVGGEVNFLKIFTIKADKNNWNLIGFDGWERDFRWRNEREYTTFYYRNDMITLDSVLSGCNLLYWARRAGR